MKATVLYYSKKGKTAFFAREIAMYLWSKGISVSLSAISDFDISKLSDTDMLLSGCWTSGWFVVGQHPHKDWVSHSKQMKEKVSAERVLFFTTYKFRTGSLFRLMKKALGIRKNIATDTLKSKTGILTAEDKIALDKFITRVSNL